MHQVVDRQHRRQVPVPFVGLARRREPRDRRRGVPVVRGHDIGTPAPRADHQIERRAAEKREPVRVVFVAVERGPIEEVPLADEVHRHVRARQLRAQNARVDEPAANRHAELNRVRRDVPAARPCRGFDRLIRRHDDTHVVAESRQRDRQRAGDVGQAAGLGERRHLGREQQDAHGGIETSRRRGLGFRALRLCGFAASGFGDCSRPEPRASCPLPGVRSCYRHDVLRRVALVLTLVCLSARLADARQSEPAPAAASPAAAPVAAPAIDAAAFATFIEDVRQEALKRGISKATLDSAFRDVQPGRLRSNAIASRPNSRSICRRTSGGV